MASYLPFCSLAMPQKSLSITKGKQIDGELYKECMTRAAVMYEHESNKTTG
jgi:hypothetical protein